MKVRVGERRILAALQQHILEAMDDHSSDAAQAQTNDASDNDTSDNDTLDNDAPDSTKRAVQASAGRIPKRQRLVDAEK